MRVYIIMLSDFLELYYLEILWLRMSTCSLVITIYTPPCQRALSVSEGKQLVCHLV